jgi:hemolysin activation/secretion protein
MVRPVKIVVLAAALAGGAVAPFVALAQQPAAEIPAPRFTINRFEVVGNTLLAQAEVERLVAPYVGANRDFSDVQRALEAIEQGYRARGYGIVQVLLPEQDITRGVVQFRVLEPRVGRVVIEGNKFFDEQNIRASLPSVREGVTPNSREMSRNLQVLNEHPLKQTNVVLRAGASEDQVDVNVKVTDERPWRVFLTLDNTGTGETGYFRSGVGVQHTNMFNRDHVLTAQYITSPTELDNVTIFGVGYRMPVYRWNSSFDFIAGYSDVDSGTVQGLFNVAGSGTIAAARWNYYLPKWGELEQKVSLGLDYRAFRNDVSVGATGGLVPDITIHPLSLTYSGLRRFAAAEVSFYGSISTNLPFGTDGDSDAFQRAGQRLDATSNYTILRYGLTYAHALPAEWQVRVAVNGQYTTDNLVSGEQFGLGGPDSVRGYQVREVSGDRGFQGQLELYTPDIAKRTGLSDAYRLRLLGFYDYGEYSFNTPPGTISQDRIASMGIGMRLNYRKMVSFRLDLAQILEPTLTRATNSQRLTGALAVIF